ncbi:class C sortase [Holdemanella biformis]|uniref:class C sortase n=2 Tax=Holdemanella biformis TaxID=1735 RepID=UPI001C391C8B|nr:class C sortase [Holdemanella biformis]MBV4131358.1 class C sortase [Holdemanella biformis]MBV4151110.1 class C sortase [Holdemanella biformis]
MKSKKKRISTKFLYIVGVLLCAFPLLSSIYTGVEQNNMLSTYKSEVTATDTQTIEEQVELAHEYNEALFQISNSSVGDMSTDILSDESYNSILDITGKGIIGTIEIPKIDVNLPIYHGTDDDVLSNGIGHIQTSSFPVGGINTRTVVSGHRGLPNAKLFTRLDELVKNDLFYFKVGGKTLAYKIYKIEVVKKDEAPDVIGIEEGKDLATMITCTPYGINTHRLIITGKRVPYSPKKKKAIKPEVMSLREIAFTALPFVIVFILLVKYVLKKRKERRLRS